MPQSLGLFFFSEDNDPFAVRFPVTAQYIILTVGKALKMQTCCCNSRRNACNILISPVIPGSHTYKLNRQLPEIRD